MSDNPSVQVLANGYLAKISKEPTPGKHKYVTGQPIAETIRELANTCAQHGPARRMFPPDDPVTFTPAFNQCPTPTAGADTALTNLLAQRTALQIEPALINALQKRYAKIKTTHISLAGSRYNCEGRPSVTDALSMYVQKADGQFILRRAKKRG